MSRPLGRPLGRPLRRPLRHAALALALLAGLGATLGACGKEGRPSAPEGEESRYIHPQVYPKPSSVVPLGEEEALTSGEVPAHAGGIKVFPSATRGTATYDSGPIQ